MLCQFQNNPKYYDIFETKNLIWNYLIECRQLFLVEIIGGALHSGYTYKCRYLKRHDNDNMLDRGAFTVW